MVRGACRSSVAALLQITSEMVLIFDDANFKSLQIDEGQDRFRQSATGYLGCLVAARGKATVGKMACLVWKPVVIRLTMAAMREAHELDQQRLAAVEVRGEAMTTCGYWQPVEWFRE